jgi:hypothetical protein
MLAVAPRGGRTGIAARVAIALAIWAAVLVWQAVPGGSESRRLQGPAEQAAALAPDACSATVLQGLRDVVAHVYHEGVSSEMSATAAAFIDGSPQLRSAVARGDAGATRRAAQEVLATGHLTNLRIMRGGRVLANVGAAIAIAPVRGVLRGPRGGQIGSYVMSVWSDIRFLAQAQSVTETRIALRVGGHSVGRSTPVPAGALPSAGTLNQGGITYDYTSLPAQVFPAGSMRIYLLIPASATPRFCGATLQDTLVNTVKQAAALIYAEEIGPRATVQVVRVQHDRALLRAVARRDPGATRLAVDALLNQHVVRLRVLAGGRLLADVGGPYVLGPRRATLRLGGRTIGTIVLSIQDDLGYLLLAHRLAGLQVVIYRGGRIVMNSLGPHPPAAPRGGSLRYRGRRYRVFTVDATAFPSGPLRISVFMPIPYS